MTQEVLPEIKTASEALETRIAITEKEVVQLKEEIKAKRDLLRSCNKALAVFAPKRAVSKKRVALAS